MASQNVFFVASRVFVMETLGDFVTFPVWWYTRGLQHVAKNRLTSIEETADHLALRLLLLNIFKPMFGQYDRAGRIISFFMRIVILIARLIFLVIYAIVQLVMIVLWVVAPAFIVYRLLQLFTITYVGF